MQEAYLLGVGGRGVGGGAGGGVGAADKSLRGAPSPKRASFFDIDILQLRTST